MQSYKQIKDKKMFFTKYKYNIGFIQTDSIERLIRGDKNNVQISWVNRGAYNKGWYADPFVLSIDHDEIIVLVEEWVDELSRGRLTKLTIDKKDYSIKSLKPILESQTHLSFPNIWKENGKVYVYPENYQSGGLYIYEYDFINDSLINKQLLVPEPLLDAQIVKINGIYYLFGINEGKGVLQNNYLYIYKALSLFGPYSYHQELYNEEKIERGAGAIIECNGKLYRPAQCCENGYGKSLIFYQLELDSKECFSEIKVGNMLPNPKGRYSEKLHTFNRCDNYVVVDGNEYNYQILVNFYRRIVKPIISLFR